MYTFPSRIRYSETDQSARLSPEALINYFQDCSTFQSEDAGVGLRYLKSHHLAWMLSSWQIDVYRYPSLFENVVTGTIPYALKGCFGYRNFFMDTADGERLASANSLWTLMDVEQMYPARISQKQIDSYPLGERLDMEYLHRKISLPKDAPRETLAPITVREHHLDTNHHVNNGQYVRMAMGCLPEPEIEIRRIRVEYKKQAHLEDVIVPVRSIRTDGQGMQLCTISLNMENGNAYCVTEFTQRAADMQPL